MNRDELTDDIMEANILDLNRNAMALLRDQQFSKALHSLKEASKLVENIERTEKKLKLHGITLNNFGCFYKRTKKPNVALKYLTKACEQEQMAAVDSVNLAGTHLNMCAIYSDLGKHEHALEQGLKALELMKTTIEYSPNFISTLVIAYHNAGVEYEFLNNLEEALDCYKNASDTATKYLGSNHPLTISMHSDYLNVEKKTQEKNMRITMRDIIKKEPVPKASRTRYRSAGRRADSKGEEISERFHQSKNMNATNKKIFKLVTSPKFPKKPLADMGVVTTDLNKIRFLTGNRLQPMFKNEFRMKSLPRGAVKVKKEIFAAPGHDRTNSAPFQKPTPILPLNFKMKEIEKKISQFDNTIQDTKPVINYDNIEKMLLKDHTDNAALKIQKHFRGYKARKEARIIKQKNNKNNDKQDYDDY